MGQRIAHVAGEAINKIILAAVGLIGNHHNIAAVGEHGILLAFALGKKFLDGGEDHAAGRAPQQGFQVVPVLGLLGRLAQQVLAAGEGAEELAIEVDSVGEHHQGGVFHLWVLDQLAGIENHGETFAAALRMPDHAGAAVAANGRGFDRAFHGFIDGMKLVVTSHFFVELTAIVLKDNEIADEIEKTILFEHAFDQRRQFQSILWGDIFAVHGAPRSKALPVGGEASGLGVNAIGDDHYLVVRKKAGDVFFVRLKLIESAFDGGVFVADVLEFNNAQRQAVDKDENIRAAVAAIFNDGELVDGRPVVVGRLVEIKQIDLIVGGFAVT